MARILVVDDDALVRRTIVSVLRNAKHAVLEANDGLPALTLLGRETVDLVIADIMMPDLDGIGLILAIRGRHPDLRVLCISGGGRDASLDFLPMAAKLGADMTLAKPFTPQQLLAAVEAALGMPTAPKGENGEAIS